MTTRCPAPPSQLPKLLPDDVVEWENTLARIFSAKGPYGASWSTLRAYGPMSGMRFDHHTPPRRDHPHRSIAYATTSRTPAGASVDPLEVAILERTQGTGIIDREQDSPTFAIWKPARALRLLLLSDSTWVARAQGNAALLSGPRGTARKWSRAVYGSYPEIDGLLWASSVLPTGRCVALYDRAADAFPHTTLSLRPLAEPFLQPALARIATTYGLTLL